jgi:CDP-diacylglycerol--glycerol-3-phosphate 3-phosphatidyltransferase
MGLTVLRLLLLPVFLWVLLLDAGDPAGARPHRWWALAVFAVMAVTDKLDGYLARRLRQTSQLGAVLDPVADKLLVMSSLTLLSFDWVASPAFAIPLWVVGVVYFKDVFIVVGTILLLSRVRDLAVHARPLGKVATALQLVLVLLTLAAPDLDRLLAGSGRVVLVWLGVAVAAVSLASCVDYAWVGLQIIRRGTPARAPSGAVPEPLNATASDSPGHPT